MKRSFLIHFCAMTLAVFSLAGEVTRPSPLETVMTFIRGIETGDVELLTSVFAEDATVFQPVVVPTRAVGREEIRAAFRGIFPNGGAGKITPRDVLVQDLGEIAIVTAHLRAMPELPVTKPTSFARRTFVLRWTGERWEIVHLHASNFRIEPPAGS